MEDQDEWTGERVRALREHLRMTQTEFGQVIWDVNQGTAQSNVSRIERGELSPSAAVRRTLQRLESLTRHLDDGPIVSMVSRILFPEALPEEEDDDQKD